MTVFERSPDGAKRLARDMRVRWALEARPAYKRAFDAQSAVFTGKPSIA